MVCQDLACQLINDHPYINVMIGGGQKNFYPQNVALPANKSEKGVRLDGRSLVTEWKNNQTTKNHRYCLVEKPSDLANCDASNTDYLLGKQLSSLTHIKPTLKACLIWDICYSIAICGSHAIQPLG